MLATTSLIIWQLCVASKCLFIFLMEAVLHFMFVSFHDTILCLFIFCIIYSFHGLFLTSGCFAHVSASQYKKSCFWVILFVCVGLWKCNTFKWCWFYCTFCTAFRILVNLLIMPLARSIQKLLLIYGFWGEGGLLSSITFSRRSKNRW